LFIFGEVWGVEFTDEFEVWWGGLDLGQRAAVSGGWSCWASVVRILVGQRLIGSLVLVITI
jgi:hypothetical protein